jgi:hypothetical protein
MYLELYFDPGGQVFDQPENAGFSEVPGLLENLRQRGIQVDVRNTGEMTEEERQAAYRKAVAVAIKSKYKIRQVFGSRRRGGGLHFGKEVPALLVYQERGDPNAQDVYPHDENGRIITIREYLGRL